MKPMMEGILKCSVHLNSRNVSGCLVTGLRDVRVTVPKAARRGDSVVLHCHYDLEGDPLYAVKWYKGRAEFYRYTPKEKPPMKLFPIPGLADLVVDVSIASSGARRSLHTRTERHNNVCRVLQSADSTNIFVVECPGMLNESQFLPNIYSNLLHITNNIHPPPTNPPLSVANC